MSNLSGHSIGSEQSHVPLRGSGANLIIHTFRTGSSGTDTPEVRFALRPQVDRRQITAPDGNLWNPALASRAGVSEGVLFQRYATKRELFFAAMVLPAPDPMARRGVDVADGFERLVELAEGMTDYFRQTVPVLLPLMAHPGFRFEEFARRHPNSPLDELRRRLVGFLTEERDAGRIREVHPGAAALMALSVAQTIAFFERMGAHGGHFPPELLRRGLRCLWDGLAPPISRPSSPAAG